MQRLQRANTCRHITVCHAAYAVSMLTSSILCRQSVGQCGPHLMHRILGTNKEACYHEVIKLNHSSCLRCCLHIIYDPLTRQQGSRSSVDCWVGLWCRFKLCHRKRLAKIPPLGTRARNMFIFDTTLISVTNQNQMRAFKEWTLVGLGLSKHSYLL